MDLGHRTEPVQGYGLAPDIDLVDVAVDFGVEIGIAWDEWPPLGIDEQEADRRAQVRSLARQLAERELATAGGIERATVAAIAIRLLRADRLRGASRRLAIDEVARLAHALADRRALVADSTDVASRDFWASALAACAAEEGIAIGGTRGAAALAARIFTAVPRMERQGSAPDLEAANYYIEHGRRGAGALTAAPAATVSSAIEQFAPPELTNSLNGLYDEQVLRAFQVEAFRLQQQNIAVTGLNFEIIMSRAFLRCGHGAWLSPSKSAEADIVVRRQGWDTSRHIQLKSSDHEAGVGRAAYASRGTDDESGVGISHYTDASKHIAAVREQCGPDHRKWTTGDVMDLMQRSIGEHLKAYGNIVRMVHEAGPLGAGEESACHFTAVDNAAMAQQLASLAESEAELPARRTRRPASGSTLSDSKAVRWNKESVSVFYPDYPSRQFSVRIDLKSGAVNITVNDEALFERFATVELPAVELDAAVTRDLPDADRPDHAIESVGIGL